MTAYYPPPKVVRVATNAIGWNRAYGRGAPSSVEVAMKIITRQPWSILQLVALVKWFGAHEVDRIADGWNPGEIGYPSTLRVDWDLHGGDEGRTWCNSITRSTRGRLEEQRSRTAPVG